MAREPADVQEGLGYVTVRPGIFVVALILTLAPAVPGPRPGSAAERTPGEKVFFDQGCHGCHTVGKAGTPIGPDLSRIGSKRSREYLVGWLKDPAAQAPRAHMPRIRLSNAEIARLATYLSELR
jgi:mono/diheme cytochrome c family protein